MRFRDTIQISNRVSVYFDDKLVYRTKNALVHGQKMTGVQMSRLFGPNSIITEDFVHATDHYTDSVGSIPTAIHVQNSAGGSNRWLPIMSYSTSTSGTAPNEICTVKYMARAASTVANQSIRYIRLGAANNWCRGYLVADTTDYKIAYGPTPSYVALPSTDFCGMPSILTHTRTSDGIAYIVQQEFGFSSTLSDKTHYLIYDGGTYWRVKLGTSLPTPSYDIIFLNCAAYPDSIYVTSSTTNMNIFSTVDLGGDNLTKASGTTMTVIWEIIYS